jgi:hypothetical protein
MKNPFKIEMTQNTQMGAWEIVLQVGGFPSKDEAQKAAKVLAEYMAERDGWSERVQ